MTETPSRRRAPGMNPDRRREMIVATALPLIAEHGATVTTSRIAAAAGIGEATLFRVFRDKDELLQACVAEVLQSDDVVDAIATIALEQPLADRLVEAAAALDAHLARIATVLGALRGAGGAPAALPKSGWPRSPAQDARGSAREESIRAVVEAVAGLFAPEAATLRLPVDQLAAVFVGQLLGRARPVAGGPVLPAAQHVDLFLHGALTGAGTAA